MQADVHTIETLDELLTSIERAVEAPSGPQKRQIVSIRELRDRLRQGQLHLAVLGQFKRGKSTLLNALLGAEVLPVAVTPLTAIPTFLAAGTHPLIREISLSGEKSEIGLTDIVALARELSVRVTEESNPNNRLELARIEARLPAAILNHSVVLIDTPGIGSTFRHNTKTTEAFLPACDAALFVVSPDPPVTEVEIAFLARVQATVAHLIVVMNKADVIEPNDLDKALTFLRRTLSEHAAISADVPIFCVSARGALRARLSNDAVALDASGLPKLERYLLEFIAHQKKSTLHNAVARKSLAIIDELLLAQDMHLQALRLPIAALDKSIDAFTHFAQQIRAEQQSAMDILEGDRKRVTDEIEVRAGEVRQRTLDVLTAEVLGPPAQRSDAPVLRQAIAAIVPALFEAERERFYDEIKSRMLKIFSTHMQRFGHLLYEVRRTASDLLGVRFKSPPEISDVDLSHEPYWIGTGEAFTLTHASGDFFERFMPGPLRRTRVRKRLREELETIVTRNVENLRWASRQNVEDTFRAFQSKLDEALEDNIEMTRAAMAAARQRRSGQADQSGAPIAAAEATKARLAAIRSELATLT